MSLPRLTAFSLCVIATLASAQEGPPPPPPAVDSGPPVDSIPPDGPPPPPQGGEYQPPPPSFPQFPRVFRPHFRWGIDGKIGYFWPASGVDFGTSARLGAQVLPNLGVYGDFGYTAGIGFGGGISATGASLSVSVLGFWHFAAMVEGDFGPFFIAAGPMVGTGGWAQATQSASSGGSASQYVVATGGFLPGIDIRTGFIFGRMYPNGFLSGFTLGVDLKVLFGRVTQVAQTAGPTGGSQSISTGSYVVGLTPMLVLGFDMH